MLNSNYNGLNYVGLVGVSIAQIREDRFTPSPDGTVAPPTIRCTVDSFSIAVTCHRDCLTRNTTTGCVTGCDRECNRTMSSKYNFNSVTPRS